MKILEELSMNAVPALQTLIYDGWILRFADGFGNRANSINPLYKSTDNIDNKIVTCEAIFRNKKLRPTFKMTPFIFPNNLDKLLMKRGYTNIHITSVQILKLNVIENPTIRSVLINYDFDEKWYFYYCKFNNIVGENKIIYKKMLENLIPFRFYISLQINNDVVACGLAVIENGFVGLFDIVVNEFDRNKGYGKQLLLNIFKFSKINGAKSAYLQVMINNFPALDLYSKLGFREVYKYYYNVLSK